MALFENENLKKIFQGYPETRDLMEMLMVNSFDSEIIINSLDLSTLKGTLKNTYDEELINFLKSSDKRIRDNSISSFNPYSTKKETFPLLYLLFLKCLAISKKIANREMEKTANKRGSFYNFIVNYRIFYLFYKAFIFSGFNIEASTKKTDKPEEVFFLNFRFMIEIGEEYEKIIKSMATDFFKMEIGNKSWIDEILNSKQLVENFATHFSQINLSVANEVFKHKIIKAFETKNEVLTKITDFYHKTLITLVNKDVAVESVFQTLSELSKSGKGKLTTSDYIYIFPYFITSEENGYYLSQGNQESNKPKEMTYFVFIQSKLGIKGVSDAYGLVTNYLSILMTDFFYKAINWDSQEINKEKASAFVDGFFNNNLFVDFLMFLVQTSEKNIIRKKDLVFSNLYNRSFTTNSFMSLPMEDSEKGTLFYEFLSKNYIINLIKKRKNDIKNEIANINSQMAEYKKNNRENEINPKNFVDGVTNSVFMSLVSGYYPIDYIYAKNRDYDELKQQVYFENKKHKNENIKEIIEELADTIQEAIYLKK